MTVFERVSRERDWWRSEMRSELRCRYSEVVAERILKIKQAKMEEALKHERKAGKGIETKGVSDGSFGVDLGVEGMETCEEDLPSFLRKREV